MTPISNFNVRDLRVVLADMLYNYEMIKLRYVHFHYIHTKQY